jgi:hypothetical protein
MTKDKEEIKKYIVTCIDGDEVYQAISPDIFETLKKEESVACENGHIIKFKINDENEIITEIDNLNENCQECVKKLNEHIENT